MWERWRTTVLQPLVQVRAAPVVLSGVIRWLISTSCPWTHHEELCVCVWAAHICQTLTKGQFPKTDNTLPVRNLLTQLVLFSLRRRCFSDVLWLGCSTPGGSGADPQTETRLFQYFLKFMSCLVSWNSRFCFWQQFKKLFVVKCSVKKRLMLKINDVKFDSPHS